MSDALYKVFKEAGLIRDPEKTAVSLDEATDEMIRRAIAEDRVKDLGHDAHELIKDRIRKKIDEELARIKYEKKIYGNIKKANEIDDEDAGDFIDEEEWELEDERLD